MVAKVAWYIPFMRWSRDGASGRIFCGGDRMIFGWVCGRGISGCMFGKGVLLGYFYRVFLGWVNGCEFGSADGFSLGNSE